MRGEDFRMLFKRGLFEPVDEAAPVRSDVGFRPHEDAPLQRAALLRWLLRRDHHDARHRSKGDGTDQSLLRLSPGGSLGEMVNAERSRASDPTEIG